MGDYPPEYVLIERLKETFDNPHCHDLYAKKIDDKYYYLIGKQKDDHLFDHSIEFFQSEFIDEIKSFEDVTKKDFSPYLESDCILNKLYVKTYLIKLAIGK